jgi:type IV pilus assembly protein PilM
MDDQSIWKKELSFRRKPKDQKDEDDSAAPDEKPTSVWKKELSFKRKPKAEAVDADVGADTPEDQPVVEEPVVAEPVAAEPEVVEETVWKKEISFGPRVSSEDEPVEAEPVVVEAPEETAWTKEVSFARTPEVEPLAAEAADETPVTEEEPVAHEQVDAEPVVAEAAEETAWTKEVSFSRTPEVEPLATKAADEAPVAAEEPEETAWTKEVSFSRTPAVEPLTAQPADEAPTLEDEPVPADEVVAGAPVDAHEEVGDEPEAAEALPSLEVAVEPWAAAPSLPPAPLPEVPAAVVPDPTPSAEVHPPVAAADLPPLPDDAPKVPFWKKELSFGGKKKREQGDEHPTAIVPAPTPSADVHPPVTAADLPPLADDAPKVPFWKKELSVGGKKRDKPVKEPKENTRKAKAERAPKSEEPKQPKQPKERKQKAPKVKVPGGSSKGQIVGLKIGASQLAAARVSNNGSAELLQTAREPLALGIVVGGELRNPDALAEALKEFFAKHGLPKKGVRLGLANNRIGVRTFEIAGIDDPKQLANAIRFRAQETLPIPIDEAVLDYHVLGEGVGEDGQPSKRVLLVVAYRELIDRYVDACRKAGITLAGIDLEAFALLRALQAPQEGVGTDASAALVVVAIGHERSTFAVSDGRVCEFTRVLEWGGAALNVAIARVLDAAPSEVEGPKRALALTDEMVPEGLSAEQSKNARDAMRRAIQTFARELVSSLQYYQNQPGSLGIGEIVLTGGTAHLPGLSGELERLIGVHVRVGDPLARMKVSKKVGQPEQIGSLAVAIGLGIED